MHKSISGTEAGDRLAIRELIEAYALCADKRDAKRQMAHVGLPLAISGVSSEPYWPGNA
jgi:hypothetical protein